MKVVGIFWQSYYNEVLKAIKGLNLPQVKFFTYPARKLEKDSSLLNAVLEEIKTSDLIVCYRSQETFWEKVEALIKSNAVKGKVVYLGADPSVWSLSSVSPEVLSKAYRYLILSGEKNFKNFVLYLLNTVLGLKVPFEEPEENPWDGIYHPEAQRYFASVEDYISWYGGLDPSKTVGILFSRHYWLNKNTEVEDALIRSLEAEGLKVIPVFYYSLKDDSLGTKSGLELIKTYFFTQNKPLISALIKLNPFFLGSKKGGGLTNQSAAEEGVEFLKTLNIPVFSPILSFYKTVEEWEKEELSSDIGWCVALPEFEGAIEPIIIAAQEEGPDGERRRIPIKDRVSKFVKRIKRWVELRNTPVKERKVVFVLHNNPCASVEATVGCAAHLDSLESLVRIMKAMKKFGYRVSPPETGKELINLIMEKKAISEFRWTTVEEIVKKGGAIAFVEKDEYQRWFEELPERVKKRMIEAWGKPPGEHKNGIPPAMLYQGKIVITGLSFGNVLVCVQPKRGCAGPRCDGKVCKILHDPDVPPPHQYIATYKWFSKKFGAHIVIHVGTHGNLEFLPGKGVGLSSSCFPDIAIDSIPHLYIYNSDNPPEGTIAKRRSYAVLVDHMQTVMESSGLYGDLEKLNSLLEEYELSKRKDKARLHILQHEILKTLKQSKLIKKETLKGLSPHSKEFEELLKEVHLKLSLIKNSQTQTGMHIFGEVPKGKDRVEFIYSILRYKNLGMGISLRGEVAKLLGYSLKELEANPNAFDEKSQRTFGKILDTIEEVSKLIIAKILGLKFEIKNKESFSLVKKVNWSIPPWSEIKKDILEVNSRIESSAEIEALLNGLSGGFVAPGASGLITRGKVDVLPTGRNFYSLDPNKVPTPSSFEVGKRLAEKLLEKFLKDEGRYPENIAFVWMANDIMWADGEGMAQVMWLLGVVPEWDSNLRLTGFKVVPLKELNRPRIDVTIRVSGILRDNFPNCIEFLDEVISTIASLDEPEELNFVKRHSNELKKLLNLDETEARLRIFCSKPGTYQAGTQLAVYASAWKEEKDLAEVFLFWNGYAYGKGVWGKPKHKELAALLKSVDATYNKVVTDEYDLFGCCCYFGTHGGITATARYLSGKEVKAYYGDSRNPSSVEVRDLREEIERVVRTKLLNPKWIEGMKKHGYKGAGDISKKIGRVYGWEATTQEVDDWIFDDIARTFILNSENRQFFKENNPWALEEISRRLIEAWQRGLWNPAKDVKEALKKFYLEVEGWIEATVETVESDFQGGSIEVYDPEEIKKFAKELGI